MVCLDPNPLLFKPPLAVTSQLRVLQAHSQLPESTSGPKDVSSKIPLPRLLRLLERIMTVEPRLEDRVRPLRWNNQTGVNLEHTKHHHLQTYLVRVALKEVVSVSEQLTVPLPLSRSIRHVEDIPLFRGPSDDAGSPRFTNLLVDRKDVGDERGMCGVCE